MKLPNLKTWWRGLPQNKRVKLIAAVLLLFAGTEVLVMAPFVLDLALLIDTVGVLFVLATAWASFAASMAQIGTRARSMARPALGFFRALHTATGLATETPPFWLPRYWTFDAAATRVCKVVGPLVVILAFGLPLVHFLTSRL